MKKSFAIVATLALVAGSLAAVWAAETPKPELISGEITCLYCHMSKASMGENPSGCVARCIQDKAMPPAIIQEGTGEIFIAVGRNGESAVKKLLPLIGKKVNLQGPIYRKNGLNMIEINMISEAL